MNKNSVIASLAVATVFMAASAASATVFFTDDFNSYSDGSLVTTSSNVWRTHSGTIGSFLNADGKAIAAQGGAGATEDVNRDTGSSLAYGGSTWYYALRFTVEDTRTTPGTGVINPSYFAHFKEAADVAVPAGELMFRGRLWVQSGTSEANFGLGFSSGTVASDGLNGQRLSWGSDLTFGTEYIAVVSYTSDDDDTDPTLTSDGFASLWINPVNSSSTSITDTLPNTNIANDATRPQTQLALRQGTGSGANGPARVLIDSASIGDSFDEVLAAVSAGGPTFSPADFDEDGFVDADDLATWIAAYGSTQAGDANGDNVTDGADFLLWQQQFTGSAPPISAVPEPATLALGVACGLALAAAGRRRSGR
jgi:hypothetical protein